MIEENNKIYFKFIKIMYKIKICFCFNILMPSNQINDQRDKHHDNQNKDKQNNEEIRNKVQHESVNEEKLENTPTTTNDSLKPDYNEYIDPSQITVTVANK